MKQEYIPYVNALGAMDEPVQVRMKIAAIAVGYACACHISMPSSKVVSPELHYRGQGEVNVKRWIGNFNESVVLDCNLALDAARAFWMMRYNAIHNCPILSEVKGDFFQSLFGATQHFSLDMISLLNSNNEAIARVYRVVCNVLTDIIDPV